MIRKHPRKFQRLSRFNGDLREFTKLAKANGYWTYSDCYFCAAKLTESEIKYFNLITGNQPTDFEIEASCEACFNRHIKYGNNLRIMR